MALVNKNASVAKLVDATDSKSVPSNRVPVQLWPEVPNQTAPILGADFLLFNIKKLKPISKQQWH